MEIIKPGEIMLSIFFLYFIIFGSFVQDIFPAKLLAIIKSNIAIRHILAYLTIFLFTYILGWYNDSALLTGKSRFETDHNVRIGQSQTVVTTNDKQMSTRKSAPSTNTDTSLQTKIEHIETHNAIITYAVYSLIIYVIFLMSSKCELTFLLIFLFMIIVTFFVHLFRLYGEIGQQYVFIEWLMEGGSFIVLLSGFILYFLRQLAEHKSNWNTLTFIFGKI